MAIINIIPAGVEFVANTNQLMSIVTLVRDILNNL